MIPTLLKFITELKRSDAEKLGYQNAIQHLDFKMATTFCLQVGVLCKYLNI